MNRNLAKWIECDKYKCEEGLMYSPPVKRGEAVIPVLWWLWDLPLCDVHLAYLHGLNPTAIRVCKKMPPDFEKMDMEKRVSTDRYGFIPTDFRKGRVTIFADKYGFLGSIHQEVEVGYYSGEKLSEIAQKIEEEDERKWG